MFRRKHESADDVEALEVQQERKVNELRASLGPLSGRNGRFCTDACLRRYLEARNWNVDKSRKMLQGTLTWRSSFKPDEIHWHQVAMEGETGKAFRANFRDRNGRTVLIFRPGMQNTSSTDNCMKHLVYLLENAILNLPEGQEQMCWLVDFTGWSISSSNVLMISGARETTNIMQNHYPERLAIAFLYDPPRIFEAFWKVVKYFLEPKTFQKVKFVYPKNEDSVELMRSYFDADNLPTGFGGKDTLQYDHEEFSKQMVEDDAKSTKLRGFKQVSNGGDEVAPEPEPEPEIEPLASSGP